MVEMLTAGLSVVGIEIELELGPWQRPREVCQGNGDVHHRGGGGTDIGRGTKES